MSSYFDEFASQVRHEVEHAVSSDSLLDAVRGIEQQLVREVSLVTGDVEFPHDLRERMQGIIAVKAIGGYPGAPLRNERQEQRLAMFGHSELVEDLHEAFHDLARRRLRTRFGLLQDSPSQILVLRNEHDSEVLTES